MNTILAFDHINNRALMRTQVAEARWVTRWVNMSTYIIQ